MLKVFLIFSAVLPFFLSAQVYGMASPEESGACSKVTHASKAPSEMIDEDVLKKVKQLSISAPSSYARKAAAKKSKNHPQSDKKPIAARSEKSSSKDKEEKKQRRAFAQDTFYHP